jgi:predicted flap endonuclease-1-like 5' DNA nuclease
VTYTLTTFAIWLVLAAVVGAIVGWLVRGVRRPAETLDDGSTGVLEHDVQSMAGDLHRVSADRDRLAGELAAAHAELSSAVHPDELAAVVAERSRLSAALAAHEPGVAELRVRLWNAEARAIELQGILDAHTTGQSPPDPDLVAGTAMLGVRVVMNDLTLVEGVGPKIAELCVQRGITTWWSLANCDLDLLRKMLAEAGPKFQVQDPTTWPHQARLLANGQWQKFKTLADALRAERFGE